MATTIEIPFELDIVDPTNANFGWVNKDTPFTRAGVYRFYKTGNPNPMGGRSLSTWKANVPKNLAGTPAWNIILHHINASGDGGDVLFRAHAGILGSGDSPAAQTVLVPNQLVGVGASGDYNITALSGSNFDADLALTAGEGLFLTLMRMPVGASGDSLTGHWDLVLPPLLRVDVS